jgi:hypothetical protein
MGEGFHFRNDERFTVRGNPSGHTFTDRDAHLGFRKVRALFRFQGLPFDDCVRETLAYFIKQQQRPAARTEIGFHLRDDRLHDRVAVKGRSDGPGYVMKDAEVSQESGRILNRTRFMIEAIFKSLSEAVGKAF